MEEFHRHWKQEGSYQFFSIFEKLEVYPHCKNIRRSYSKITGNQLPVHFPLFLQAPINSFRNQAQYGTRHVLFLVM